MRLLCTLTVALAIALPSHPLAAARRHRVIPAGHHWGRCHLVVHGQRLISGPCIYEMYPDGGFHIDGPRQIFNGIDYPRSDIMAGQRSTDYWANVSRDEGRWVVDGNDDIAAVHAAGPAIGPLRREGACFV